MAAGKIPLTRSRAAEPSALLTCSAMKIVMKREPRRLGSAKVQLSPRGEISGVPVSYRDNNSVCVCECVYSAQRQIRRLRQTVGWVYQHRRRPPRLRLHASLTLRPRRSGTWPTLFTPPSTPISHLLCISPLPPCSLNSSSSLRQASLLPGVDLLRWGSGGGG